jgi:hypothetical protein
MGQEVLAQVLKKGFFHSRSGIKNRLKIIFPITANVCYLFNYQKAAIIF